jgi:hypothetical protein
VPAIHEFQGGALEELAPGVKSAPKVLLDAPEIGARLKRGDRIAGAIAVNCAVCWRGYTYRVYLTYGEGGWIAEVEAMTDAALIAPQDENGHALRGQELEDVLLRWANGGAAPTRVPIAPTAP